jgi:hypothetical protein
MDEQTQMDGQNVHSQRSSNPPEWFQTFVQQMVQTHNDQMNEVMQRINAIDQRTQAQVQPYSSVDQVPPLPTPTTAPTSTIMPTPTDTLVSEELTRRPRPKLPDVPSFSGKRSEWRSWKNRMTTKLRVDKLAIGNPIDHFAYIEACLEDNAAKMVLAFVEEARLNKREDPDAFMTYMDNVYGDSNAEERANNKLNTMSQGKEAFTTFLPKFERTLAEAGGNQWNDHVKINTLKRMLNQELRTSLVFIPEHPSEYHTFIRTLQTLASRLATLDPRKPTVLAGPRPITPKPAPTADEMDWQPSANKVQVPADNQKKQKRAQWVSKDALEKRRNNNLCLRCGGKGHFIDKCTLLPARPPQQGQTKVKVTDVKNEVKEDDEVNVVEELDSDTESGKE